MHRRLSELPRITGSVVGCFAVLCLLWSISPALRHLTHTPREYLDDHYVDAPDTSLVWVLVLLLLAAALARRKRVAWFVLVVYCTGFAVANALEFPNGHAVVAFGVHLVLVAILLVAHGEFSTKVRRGAVWLAAAVLAGGLAAGVLVGWLLVELAPGTLPAGQRLAWAGYRVTALVYVDNDQFDGHTHIWVSFLLGLFGAVALLAAILVLFRSQRATNALTGHDESALRGLLERADVEDSLGYFATRRDKAVVFAPSGKAAVTYRVEVGVCLASGDPIGLTQAWPQAIEAWVQLARRYGWTPAVMGASEIGARAYRSAGLTVLQLGDEAILHPRTFHLGGPEMKQVRQATNRLRKLGFTARIRRHRDIGDFAAVEQRADRWRDTESERGFSMALGRLGDPLDGNCLLVEAVDRDGEVLGMLSFVPWGANGISLDLMRRDPKGPNGIMEFMVSELALGADAVGVSRISLNFAVFRSVFEAGGRIGAGPVLRLWRDVLLFLSRWWQLEALYRSNVKYQPEWVPRYLCFEDSRAVARVGVAAALAEGFLPRIGGGAATQQHTGTHDAAPDGIAGLHADGSAPDRALPAAATPAVRRPDQVRVRLDKLDGLVAAGIDPYPVAYPPTHTIGQARAAVVGTRVRIAGRILRIRDYGGVRFVLVRDWSADLQVVIDRAIAGPQRCAEFDRFFDLGDLIECSGTIGHSRSGELSLLAADWRMNGKCLHPLPDKWKGLSDPEARVRQRYVDMAVNPDTRAVLAARSAVVRALRDTLADWGYLEVETPVLQRIHGGANAAPFTTHSNAYDLDLYLRIAPELYLKRLCVGGLEKVFELGRTFRNEGVDHSHNPEFTILEAYAAHSDYEQMRMSCQELIQRAAVAANGDCVVMRPEGPVRISGDWPVKTVHGAVSDALGAPIDPDTPVSRLRELCDQAEVAFRSDWDAGQIVLELYEHLVEARTELPTFYKDFPTSVSPLTRAHRRVAGVTERWDLVAWGVELGTAYSELTDPIEQRQRLTEQSLRAVGGDAEAMELDEDFLLALEHAMPPTGGLGLGVDRIVMLVTGRSIRETLPFPLAKPR